MVEETPSELLAAPRLPSLHAQHGKQSDHPGGTDRAIVFADISREPRREQKLGAEAFDPAQSCSWKIQD